MGEDKSPGPTGQPESFTPTSGRIFGVVGMLVGATFLVAGLLGSPVVWGLSAAGALVVVLAWTALLRPSASIDGEVLVLRGMVDTVRIPLAAIEEVSVRQVLAVLAGDKRYTSPAVGRSRKQMFRDDRRPVRGESETGVDAVRLAAESYGLFVEDRIRESAADARDRAGIGPGSDEQLALGARIERRVAVPEVVALVLTGLGALLALVL